jgi:hypothetical protein|tara:strand:+ start:481 stop:705 length:225 start_codon:yes stop_codon:yes gene_type:complete
MAVVFVGFRTKRSYDAAVRIFGKPDIISVTYDARTFTDVVDGDTVVFAKGTPKCVDKYVFDDSMDDRYLKFRFD